MSKLLRAVALTGAASGALLTAVPASATVGYFLNGVSIRDKGMAGATVADPDDSLTIAVNPAGLAEIDSQVDIGASLFMPRRQFTGTGPGFTPSGTVKSSANYFLLPNAGYSHRINEDSAWGIALFGNGGLNTDYDPAPANPVCGTAPFPAPNGVFCGGRTGVNLIQAFVSVGYARKFGDHVTIGVAPVLGLQIFKARGLAAFAFDPFGNPLTVDPSALTDNGNSTSAGVGIRIGALFKLSPQFRIGASYQSEMYMSKFKKYAGLFEDHGKFNIPSNFSVGASFDATPGLTFDLGFRHINYSDIPAVSNSSTIPQQFGSKGGPGFGWRNVNEFKLGAEGKINDRLKLRAGAAFNNNPVRPSDVTINILAPGVSKQHFTVGAEYASSAKDRLSFSFLYSPNASTTGTEVTPGGPNPFHTIKLQMHQFEVGIGWSHKL